MLTRSCLFLILLLLSCVTSRSQVNSGPLIDIDSGRLEGARFGSSSNEVMFLGIPYAAPPTGELRWKPPESAHSWKGVFKADKFAPTCPQAADDLRWETEEVKDYSETLPYYQNFRTDEDCLYLNVWTTSVSGKYKEPVMVWIHGGGGVAGNSWTPPFGPALARRGVVLVSVEFRIGVLGNLAHPALSAESPHHVSGNYGTLDQIAALQWVQRNVASFGGDPGNVTIFGHSDGGNKVCILLASPLARGLFHHAILESGQCSDVVSPELTKSVHYDGNDDGGTAEEAGVQLVHDLKIAGGPNVLAALRHKSADEIIQGTRNPALYSNPTVDGWVLLQQPLFTFREGRQTRVPVIIGSTDDEMGSLYNPQTDPSTLIAYKQVLNSPRYASNSEELFRMYPATNDSEARVAFMKLGTDDGAHGAYSFARDMAQVMPNTYLFYFTYPSRGKFSGHGAVHGAELKFLTGIFRKSSGPINDQDKELMNTMQEYWTRFAATGDPNGPDVPKWPAYNTNRDLCLEIGNVTKAVPVPNKDKYSAIDKSLRGREAELQKKNEIE